MPKALFIFQALLDAQGNICLKLPRGPITTEQWDSIRDRCQELAESNEPVPRPDLDPALDYYYGDPRAYAQLHRRGVK